MGEEGSAGDANPWFRQKRVEEERGGFLLLWRKQYPLTFPSRYATDSASDGDSGGTFPPLSPMIT